VVCGVTQIRDGVEQRAVQIKYHQSLHIGRKDRHLFVFLKTLITLALTNRINYFNLI